MMCLLNQIHSTIITILVLVAVLVPLTSVLCFNSRFPSSFSEQDPVRRAPLRLSKTLIGDDGKVYACAGRTFFAFESNGSIAWAMPLNYTCNTNIAPVDGGWRKIYLVAENRLLKIYTLKVGTSDSAVEVFFGQQQGGDIVGVSVSTSSSCVLITVKNRGLFAYRLHGKLMWSAGPVLYQHGYRQGCRRNITNCFFTSAPVIDHCEASVYMLNTVGELYSLSVRGPYFKWIQDLSSFGSIFTVTAGNNGRVYVTVPDKALVLALDVSRGTILWQGNTGPLSSPDYEPVIDANGWISVGSLDGFLYSFSPNGALKRFPKSAGSNSVIQINPVVDCSGYAVCISRTELEGKTTQRIGEYTYFSAMKPRNAVFTMLNPASGTVYFSESDSSKLLMKLSQTDLRRFLLDERGLLAFLVAARKDDPLPCHSTRQKLASTCSLVKPKSISIYTGNEKTILLFLLFESVLLVLLAALVWHCCVFWKKRKLQSLDLGMFLEKRRSLRLQKRAFDRTISELEQRASEEPVANEVLEQLGDLVKERESIKKKLSTTYSLGRDGEKSRSKSLLPLYDEKSKSYSFQDSKRGSVTVFHTASSSSSSSEDTSHGKRLDENEFIHEGIGKGKSVIAEGDEDAIHEDCSSSSASDSKGFADRLALGRSCSEIEEVKMASDARSHSGNSSRSLRRRSMSMN